jgi:hypothetical protein
VAKRKKLYTIAKDALIAALVVLCIFQTSSLWFGGTDFNTVFPRLFGGSAPEPGHDYALNVLTAPYRVFSGRNGRYTVTYNYVAASPETDIGNQVIRAALNYGIFVGAYTYEPIEAIIIYEYAAPIPSSVFDRLFDPRLHRLSANITFIDGIYFTADGDSLYVYFADRAKQLMYAYTLHDGELAANIRNAGTEAGSFYFGRTGGVLVPKWHDTWHTFSIVAAEPHFPAPASLLPSSTSVEEKVMSFFDRPSGVVSRTLGTYHMFASDSSESVVVRYHAPHILEYSNFSFISNQTLLCFVSSFALALDVINRDQTLDNEIFLAAYRQNPLGYTFYFDAAVNNFPVSMSRELSNVLGMNHFIEITVDNDFINYKRYAVTYRRTEANGQATIDFVRFSEYLHSFTGQSVGQSNENHLRFGYMATGDDSMVLHWSIGWFIGENRRMFDSKAVE